MIKIERTLWVVPPGEAINCASANWRDVYATVQRGTVSVEAVHGGSVHLVEGDSFYLAAGTAAMRNLGPTSAVVSTVGRRRDTILERS